MVSPPYDRVHYISQSESREAILSWFSNEQVMREEKEAFIDALVNFQDRCDSFFSYQTYFLAAEAIALFLDCSQADAIVGQLLKWSYAFCRTSKSDWKTYPQALTIAAREALKRTDIKRVANRLAEIVHTTDSLVVLRRAAVELGKLNPGDESAIAALEQLVQYTQLLHDRFKAVSSLIEVDLQNALIIPALIEIVYADLRSDSRWVVRDVLWKFREIAIGNEAAIAVVVELLEGLKSGLELPSDEYLGRDDVFLCNQCAETLGFIGVVAK